MSSEKTGRANRILIIDDSEVMLARMKRVLIHAGYEVITTTQIVGNARHLASCDLIIVDYHMPGLDGSAVAQSMKSMRTVAQSGKHHCAVYLYTSDKSISANYAQLGFDGVLTSKGDEAELVRQVAAYFRLARMRALRGSENKGT
jgi:two-component system OmpR family response regulator